MTLGRGDVAAARLPCDQHENGPPDIETIDRRRVDPPAGCRVTTEPATVAGRRSVERSNRRTTEYVNSSPLAARAWGRRAALRCLGVLLCEGDAYPAPAAAH